jgi:hypothetical protein
LGVDSISDLVFLRVGGYDFEHGSCLDGLSLEDRRGV